MQDITYRKLYNFLKGANTVLGVLVFVFAFYLFIDPLIPEFSYQIQKLSASFAKPAYAAGIAEARANSNQNRLIIPKIFVDSDIIEAQSIKDIHEKVWRRPNTRTPDTMCADTEGEGKHPCGRTVMIAHNYATIGGLRESTFYKLDELKNGDEITVEWKGNTYTYRVFNTKIVPPTDVKIEFNTDEPILTLYTCHPRWTGANRFVVDAKLVSSSNPVVSAALK